ncbi:tRNA dimethylallyltransferase [Gemmobacter megaterium]|uniref:tRNA dimethylallyltransferase n=1 Tax=Gemmobacter megaterium TaxID=1086013 RepID=A0A1N7NRY1_9RHOB|nr:tRNA (adenosine(37)-N6)-dimethylallyltransferase MiaA [Gemmobacter megaterium]SIT01125.1 tRNA dimethylallyltransferase [Gemmobacter megaterium]
MINEEPDPIANWLTKVPPDRPVLIAGPTASGKSGLALALARAQGRQVVNADALQVYSCWRVLTARPSPAEEAQAPHRLYGHVSPDQDYSVGHWLREVAELLKADPRPVIVGGTGLYFTALTAGLAEIPPTPPEIRALADRQMAERGHDALLAELDGATAARIDRRNPVRIQRAWEVLQATGRGLAAWQDETGPPVLPLESAHALVLRPGSDWLDARITRRFGQMIQDGALHEVQAVRPIWAANRPWARAIGAPELMAHLDGRLTLDVAVDAACTATRQYAKRQRTWMRNRLGHWPAIDLPPMLRPDQGNLDAKR